MSGVVAVSSDLFCLSCGYNLTGLDLPRACPECGNLSDPFPDLQRAREWFCGREAWCWSLRSSSQLPTGIPYALIDERTAEFAVRRIVLGLWVLSILNIIFVLAASCVAIEKHVYLQYYLAGGPVRTEELTEFDNLFHLNLHFNITLPGLISGLTGVVSQTETVTATRYCWRPVAPDAITGIIALLPFLVTFCSFHGTRCLLRVLAGITNRIPVNGDTWKSLLRATSLVAFNYAIGLALLEMVILGLESCEILMPSRDFGIAALVLLVIGSWVCLWGWARFVWLDSARVFLPHRVLSAFLLMSAAIGLPVLGYSALRVLLWR